jgi:hypothetical protein
MTKSFACPIASTIDAPQSPKPTSRGAYPAADARFLQPVADGIGGSLIGDGVADEDVVGHAAASFGPERSRPKGIKCQNSSKAKAIRFVPGQLLLARRAYRAATNGKLSSPGLPSLPRPARQAST